jgi:hypothetical protein
MGTDPQASYLPIHGPYAAASPSFVQQGRI